MLLTLAVVILAAFIAWRLLQTRSDRPQPTPDRRRPPAPRGPDDDPDFLRSLDN